MAAHRYWRIQPLTQFPNQTGWGEIQMAETEGGANLIGTGAASAQGTYGGSYAPERAVDGNTGSNWFGGGRHLWWQYDFGAAVIVEEVRIACAVEDQSPRGFAVQSSDDGAVFTDEWYGWRFPNWTNGEYVSFARPILTGGAARYWGLWTLMADLEVLDIIIAQLELAATAGGPDLTAPGQAYLAVTANGDLSPMFDDTPTAGYWYSNDNGARPTFAVDLGTEQVVAEARLQNNYENNNNNKRIPGVGIWIAGNNGRSFAKIADYNSRDWAAGESRTFALGAGGPPAPASRRRQSVIVA